MGVMQGPLEVAQDILCGDRSDQMGEIALGIQVDGAHGQSLDLLFGLCR